MRAALLRIAITAILLNILVTLGCAVGDVPSTGQVDPPDPIGQNMDMGGSSEEDMAVDMAPEDLGPEDMGPDLEPDMGPEDMGPAVCDRDDACTDPEVCIVNPAGMAVCDDPVGQGTTGDGCSMGSDCASGVCLNGLCASPCATEQDCPNGYSCAEQSVPLEGGGSATLNVCVEIPPACMSDETCVDPRVCVVDRSGVAVSLTCRVPMGMGALGDMCAADGECAAGLCLDDVCATPCQRPVDCSADGSFICTQRTVMTTGGGSEELNVCVPKPTMECVSDSECSLPDRCVATRGQREVTFACDAPNAGGGEAGEPCANDAACAQNLCLDGACVSPCMGDGDCDTATGSPCTIESVTLQNNNTDSVQVCTPPVPCENDSVCRISETCYAQRSPGNLGVFCRAPNVNGAQLGEVCSNDLQCADGLCFQGRFDQVCTGPCSTDADCTVPGYECRRTDVPVPGGQTVATKICAPKDPPICFSNDQCATGLTCAVVPNRANTALESVCIPATGKQATGVMCTRDDDCASRVCLGNQCAAPCETGRHDQCAMDQLCVSSSVSTLGLSGTFDMCTEPPDVACTSTRECTDGVRVCSDVRVSGTSASVFCQVPRATGGALGATCAMDSACRSDLCLTATDTCSVACTLDSDCSATANQVCTTYAFGNERVNTCIRGCTDNGACSGGDICTINGDTLTNDLDQICFPPIGASTLGATCNGSADCDTGLCLNSRVTRQGSSCVTDAGCLAGETCECPVAQPGCTTGRVCGTSTLKCSRLCDSPSDCVGGVAGNTLTTCNTDVFVTRPDGVTTKMMSFCGD